MDGQEVLIFLGPTFFKINIVVERQNRTVGIEQFQKAEFVSFELTEHIGRVLKCFFFSFLYLKIQSMLNIVFILIA